MTVATSEMNRLQWTHRYAKLGLPFVTTWQGTPLSDVHWVAQNHSLLQKLGLDESFWATCGVLEALSGNQILNGMQPHTSVYSGHQFGVWAGQLGDGRALWLGESRMGHAHWEWQLKGAGKTPYSRMGDGRAVLRSSIREYLCSEAMHGLGIPTTRALCITGSPDAVLRESVETAAVVTRIAPSFLRFGHFEHFAALGQDDKVKQLADFAIEHYFADLKDQTDAWRGNIYAAFLHQVVRSTAQLMAKWQAVGFCHGVMNTDNMSVLGLTLDYGPFQFLDGFDHNHICNHSDHQGRYSYANQPKIGYWNLFCLAQALWGLIKEEDLAMQALEPYQTLFPEALDEQMRRKLGLTDIQQGDRQLATDVLACLSKERVDFTIFWRRLSVCVKDFSNHSTPMQAWQLVLDLFLDAQPIEQWLDTYTHRLSSQNLQAAALLMLQNNPKFVLRNHLGEEAIQKAKTGDFFEIDTLLHLLHSPYDEHSGYDRYANFPPSWASSIEISCSS